MKTLRKKISHRLPRLARISLCALSLGLPSCSAYDRISELGQAPSLAPIENPTYRKGYQPVSLPMPAPALAAEQTPNSLWQAGARAFFRDMRAARVGDILTVIIKVDDQAKLDNQTTRTRNNTDTANITGLFGYQNQLGDLFFSGATGQDLLNTDSQLSNAGTGKIDRKEEVDVKVAALVTQVLPNGNLVVQGKQQMVVNYDMREMLVSGIVRPQDITTANTINFEQIAEARISYGGRGQIMDVQQPRYGSQLLDVIMPF